MATIVPYLIRALLVNCDHYPEIKSHHGVPVALTKVTTATPAFRI
jgi:hypothetical protein